jgi:hypothetical protein
VFVFQALFEKKYSLVKLYSVKGDGRMGRMNPQNLQPILTSWVHRRVNAIFTPKKLVNGSLSLSPFLPSSHVHDSERVGQSRERERARERELDNRERKRDATDDGLSLNLLSENEGE